MNRGALANPRCRIARQLLLRHATAMDCTNPGDGREPRDALAGKESVTRPVRDVGDGGPAVAVEHAVRDLRRILADLARAEHGDVVRPGGLCQYVPRESAVEFVNRDRFWTGIGRAEEDGKGQRADVRV